MRCEHRINMLILAVLEEEILGRLLKKVWKKINKEGRILKNMEQDMESMEIQIKKEQCHLQQKVNKDKEMKIKSIFKRGGKKVETKTMQFIIQLTF